MSSSLPTDPGWSKTSWRTKTLGSADVMAVGRYAYRIKWRARWLVLVGVSTALSFTTVTEAARKHRASPHPQLRGATAAPVTWTTIQRSKVAECNDAFRGPLSGTDLVTLLRAARAVRVTRGKYETTGERRVRLNEVFAKFGIREGAPVVVSFAFDRETVTFDPNKGRVDISDRLFDIRECTGLGESTDFRCFIPSIGIATMRGSHRGGAYVGQNVFGATARVEERTSLSLGIVEPAPPIGSPSNFDAPKDLWTGNPDSVTDFPELPFALKLTPAQTDDLKARGQWFVQVTPMYPFAAFGHGYSGPTLDNPVESRPAAEAFLGKIGCVAIGVPGQPPAAVRVANEPYTIVTRERLD